MADDVNMHKKMAGIKDSGNFGVDKHPGREAPHPDIGMEHKPMDDAERMAPINCKDRMMQASPDHGFGKGVKDHFVRGGKV